MTPNFSTIKHALNLIIKSLNILMHSIFIKLSILFWKTSTRILFIMSYLVLWNLIINPRVVNAETIVLVMPESVSEVTIFLGVLCTAIVVKLIIEYAVLPFILPELTDIVTDLIPEPAPEPAPKPALFEEPRIIGTPILELGDYSLPALRGYFKEVFSRTSSTDLATDLATSEPVQPVPPEIFDVLEKYYQVIKDIEDDRELVEASLHFVKDHYPKDIWTTREEDLGTGVVCILTGQLSKIFESTDDTVTERLSALLVASINTYNTAQLLNVTNLDPLEEAFFATLAQWFQ